jgi:hypothetical protein
MRKLKDSIWHENLRQRQFAEALWSFQSAAVMQLNEMR